MTISWLCWILDSTICWHLQNILSGAVWIISGAFFPESKTKVDPNEIGHPTIKNALKKKTTRLCFTQQIEPDCVCVWSCKTEGFLMAFGLGSWYTNSIPFPGEAQKAAATICFLNDIEPARLAQIPFATSFAEGEKGRWLKPCKVLTPAVFHSHKMFKTHPGLIKAQE